MTVTLFFDCETTGLPTSYTPPTPATVAETYKNARLVELAVVLFNDQTLETTCHSTLVKPSNFTVMKSPYNACTHEKCEADGLPIQEVIKLFNECVDKADIIVAYNIEFDMSILMAESFLCRTPLRAKKSTPLCCAMKDNVRTKWMKLEVAWRGCQYRSPDLATLPHYLFHVALFDTLVLKDIWFNSNRSTCAGEVRAKQWLTLY